MQAHKASTGQDTEATRPQTFAVSEGQAGASRPHIPVLLREVLQGLAHLPKPMTQAVIADGTFGAGGYAQAYLKSGAKQVFGFDRDPTAIAAASHLKESYQDRLTLIEGRFSDMADHLMARDILSVDAVVLDIGVSSMQIDQAERGFSFQKDGPLDMRMSTSGPSAADVVNTFSHGALAHIFKFLGEERHAGRIASAIIKAREVSAFESTGALSALIEKTIPRHGKDKIHPATRCFQALRIFVNQELEELAQGLSAAEALLSEGGVLIVVSFHSLEDRIVKNFLQNRSQTKSGGSRHLPQGDDLPSPSFTLPIRKAITARDDEVSENPRARSAKLRVGQRTGADAFALDMNALGVPALPPLYGDQTTRIEDR